MFLEAHGYQALECSSDEEALTKMSELKTGGRQWPCHFSGSDTSGEKMYEEFNDPKEAIDLNRFSTVGVVTQPIYHGKEILNEALAMIESCRERGQWTKQELVDAVGVAVPELQHVETHKNLDQKM